VAVRLTLWLDMTYEALQHRHFGRKTNRNFQRTFFISFS